ncbi:UDP-N-acetylmuramoyl-L-alanine--D-glutamate ligase [Ramlibacter sp. G-1-2-2]|uniref:UDP-N-acetylmuramoylalanine--D-glutamate ligase n=1 Tax=Ramlibacter agri TaxID=2728837 RepID=A0A848HF13_9BURK|nr:UDP-N-acetylmuramoyl-L-alanine--D-glutamate ligase [Ramlibacter agri]NML47931.1 UDP-N-acetylmuramoyl-L-alanine--D-glutamate ligase [Ramlibacter agri]
MEELEHQAQPEEQLPQEQLPQEQVPQEQLPAEPVPEAAAPADAEGEAPPPVVAPEPAPPPVPLPPVPQRVLVLGCGLSGLAMARWCASQGSEVVVADTRAEPPQLAQLRAEVPAARFVSGEFSADLLEGMEQVLRSPGLSPAQVAVVVDAARSRDIAVRGELSLFNDALTVLRAQQGYHPAVLAVTGTNGKTTVTSLTGQLVERSGKTVGVAGNIGPSLLDTLAQKRDAGALPQVWVLELSSFQLEGISDFEPTAATVLNISQDHLDWHGSMEAYAAAKARIFGQKGVMVLNRDDPVVLKMLPAPVRLKGGKYSQRACMTFGGDLPPRPGDFGLEVVHGMAWLVRAHEADETEKRRKDEEPEIHLQRLMPADALRIRGRHNAINALSALALATAAGCQLAPMLYGLREYRGEPHRVEPVGSVNDIEYFDDSKGTNVGATVAALLGLGAERKLVVILGGDGKGQDFSPLAAPVARHARAAVLIGRDAPQIRAVLEPEGVLLLEAASMEEAVRMATERAHAGDAVLMSPACASFDMFRNYEHRAQVFQAAVQAVADDAGAMLDGSEG